MSKSLKIRSLLCLTLLLLGGMIAASNVADTETDDLVIHPLPIEISETPLFVIRVDGKEGFMNPKGEVVIPATFEKVYPFSDGLAAVQVERLWGFINTDGKMVIEPQFVMVHFFSDGLAAVREKEFNAPWGYIDKQGKMVIKPIFDHAEQFHNGIARVGSETTKSQILSSIADVGQSFNYDYINREGEFVSKPPSAHYLKGQKDELLLFKRGDLFGYKNADGQVVIDAQFLGAGQFSEGLACARKKDLFGYIDSSGEFVIPPRFQYPANFSDGLAGVPINEKGWGFIDKKGNTVIEPRFNWIYAGFRYGVAEVTIDGKAGYLNKSGEWVWEPTE